MKHRLRTATLSMTVAMFLLQSLALAAEDIDTAAVENTLETWNPEVAKLVSFRGVHMESETRALAFYTLKHPKFNDPQNATAKILYLNDKGWYLYEVTFAPRNNPLNAHWWRNVFVKIE